VASYPCNRRIKYFINFILDYSVAEGLNASVIGGLNIL
jgi:hypothetical protein